MNSSLRDDDASIRRLAVLILTIFFTSMGVILIAAGCWFLVPPNNATPTFFNQFTVLPGFLYTDQPAKSAAFEVCCLALPFLLFFSSFGAARAVALLPDAALQRIIPAGLALHLIAWLACIFPLFYCPHPPFAIAPQWLLVPRVFPPPVPAWGWILSLIFGASLVLVVVAQPGGQRMRFRVMLPILLLWLLLVPTRFYAPSEITDELRFTYHLNSLLDALSQATNGHHLLVNFPHIYGGYIELLAPVLRLLPRTIGAPLVVLAIPSALSVLCLLLTARLVIRPPLVLLLACLALLSLTFLLSLPDPNYGYATARGFCPALGLLLVALYLRRPTLIRYVLASLAAAIAPIWNLDTGLVLWASWFFTLLAAELVRHRWAQVALHLTIQAASGLGAWMVFFLHVRLESGRWPDLHLLFYFQSLVVQSGYFCVPLLVPNAWISLVLLYITTLAIAFLAHLRDHTDPETRLVLFLSLLGIGTFSYYMGRSAEPNLISIASPGVLLLAILAGRADLAVRRHLLPPIARWFLLPWSIMVLWWVFLLFAYLPFFLLRGPQLMADWRNHASTPFETRVATVTQWIQPQDPSVYFLSDNSGFYYYLTQTTRPLQIPGTIELLRTRDMEVLFEAIRQRKIGHLVVDSTFYTVDMYRPDIYHTVANLIAQNYRLLKVSPFSSLALYVPRTGNAPP